MPVQRLTPTTLANGVALVSSIVRERAQAQREDFNALDAKAATLIGFAGVLLGLLLSDASVLAHWNGWLTCAVAMLMISATLLAFALWARGFVVDPNEERLLGWMSLSAAATEHLVAVTGARAIDRNAATIRKKALAVRFATGFLVAALLATAVGILSAQPHVRDGVVAPETHVSKH